MTRNARKQKCISQKHLGVKLVEFFIAHISCSVSCIELKFGTIDEEGITQQIVTLCISVLGIFFEREL